MSRITNYELRITNYGQRFLLVAALFILYSLFLIQTASAAGVVISPPFREVVLEKDQPKSSFEISVRNDTSTAQSFRLSVQDFGSLDESGGVAFLGTKASNLEYKYSLAGWLIPASDTVNLEPGQSQKVMLTVENRPSLSPGGHYGAVLLTSQLSSEGGKKPRVVINQVLSSLVLVKKFGGEVYGLRLDQFKLDHNLWRLPAKIKLRFQNTGNVHVIPRGTVEVKTSAGKVIAKGVLNPESGWVLPESFRLYPIDLKRQTTAWLPGRYQLEFKYRYDGKTDFETTRQTIYYLGRASSVGLASAMVVLSAVLALLIRSRSAKNKPQPKA